MKGLLIILLVLGISPVRAQVSLNLEKCREMALESSKKMSIATKQGRRLNLSERLIVRIFAQAFGYRVVCLYAEKSSFTIDGGYLPTFVPDANGELVYNLYIDPATKLPVMGKDGWPLSAEICVYARY